MVFEIPHDESLCILSLKIINWLLPSRILLLSSPSKSVFTIFILGGTKSH